MTRDKEVGLQGQHGGKRVYFVDSFSKFYYTICPICRSRIRQTMVQPSSGQQYLVSYHHDHPVEICISQGHALLEIRLLLPAANAQESAECATTRKFQKTVSCQRVLLIISGVLLLSTELCSSLQEFGESDRDAYACCIRMSGVPYFLRK